MSARVITGAPTQRVRDLLAARLVAGIVEHREAAWPFGELTETQLLERAGMEAAMRADQLRGLPSVFGALA